MRYGSQGRQCDSIGLMDCDAVWNLGGCKDFSPEHGTSMSFRNVSTHVQAHTASQLRWPPPRIFRTIFNKLLKFRFHKIVKCVDFLI
jgi:hypothetical protein